MEMNKGKNIYVNFNAVKSDSEYISINKNFPAIVDAIYSALCKKYEDSFKFRSIYNKDKNAIEGLMKCFMVSSEQYKVIKEIATSKTYEINFKKLLNDIILNVIDINKVYEDFISDLETYKSVRDFRESEYIHDEQGKITKQTEEFELE